MFDLLIVSQQNRYPMGVEMQAGRQQSNARLFCLTLKGKGPGTESSHAPVT
ncbi:hypothetical protein Dd1591_0254 [Dickeya chrysanthemi Ech1591]|uniref:Uncharacterized protein n=1 Tax=Dickeya chrysanthemi (strain Ech1591) TaxID=561229 RepID=C6CH34_DICC1|nr:hypothetical protein Dd1591_0254 [Dickeya chrysanthemi Ech1591]